MRAWWPQISDTPFTGHRLRASTIRDPLIRYIHRCIVTTISGRIQSQEWVKTTDLFSFHSLMTGRPCNLARLFCLVLRLVLPPKRVRDTVGRRLYHPPCTHQRHVSFASRSVGDPATVCAGHEMALYRPHEAVVIIDI
ncbi:hypothetical protein R6Q57_007548 [Mikania cordata]